MCGILGLYSKKKINELNFSNSLKLINHRGPDQSKTINYNKKYILGFNRLSVIDINGTNSYQPFENEELIIAFNGEIYNFKKLARELGIRNSLSNSEVFIISKLIEKYGETDFIKFIEGMFIITIFSKKKNKIFLFRDRIGERFIYFFKDKNNFIFSSEIRPIINLKLFKKQINLENLHEYFLYGSIYENNQTFFKNIFQLGAGNYLIFDCEKFSLKQSKYYQLEKTILQRSRYKINEIKKSLREAINSRMISDANLGLLLSSGIDSTFLVSKALPFLKKKTNIFTACSSEKRLDESLQAKKSVFYFKKNFPNKNPIHHIVKNKQNIKTYKQLIYLSKFYDSPIHYNMSPMLYSICEKAKKYDLKVLVGGEGLDEIAFGYERFHNTFDKIKNLKDKNKILDLIFFGSGYKNRNIISKILNSDYNYKSLESYKFLKRNYESISTYKLQMIFSIKYKLQTLLYRNDRIGFLNSIELRCPFLYPKLVETFINLPFSSLYNKKNKKGKMIIRKLSKGFIPNEVSNYEKKLPFPTNFSYEIDSVGFKKILYNLINSRKSFTRNYLSFSVISKIFEKHYSKKENYSYLIWRIFSLEIWYKNFFKII